MAEKCLHDISEVCVMLGITSRTLRFYEEKGIVHSTTIGISSRRQYTAEQLEIIKNVLVLRALGLSVKAIAELQTQKSDLKEAILSKRVEIYASIESRINEINLLNEALTTIESDKSIFTEDWKHSPVSNTEENKTARICTDAVLNGDDDTLYQYLSTRLTQYMPQNVYRVVRKDTFSALGEYISIDKTIADERFPNIQHSYVRFSKSGLRITFVFYGGKIDGFWFGYYEKER